MKNLKDKKKILMVLSVLLLVVIAVGVTYAFFTYSKSGTTENTLKSGSITFWYDEQNREGNGISISDALPLSDTNGKSQTKAFNFKIVSTTSTTTTIPYEITLRQKANTDNIGNIVKVYLAKTASIDATIASEEEVELSLFSSLSAVTKNTYSEKLLHTDIVPASEEPYTQFYRLKMWLDSSADYSDGTLNNKTFSVMVNVYANGHVLDANSNNSSISSLKINNVEATKIDDEDYDYDIKLAEGTSLANILVVPENEYSEVSIQSVGDNLATDTTSISKIASSKSKEVPVSTRYNYYKIVVTPEVGTPEESILRIKVLKKYNSITDVKNSFKDSEIDDILACEYNKEENSFIDCDYYNDLQKTFNEKNTGYIEIENNILVEETVILNSNYDHILDLNGKEIKNKYFNSIDSTYNTNHGVIAVYGKLVINDNVGTGGVYTGTTSRALNIRDNGVLIVNGGSYAGRQAVMMSGINSYAELNGGQYDSKMLNTITIENTATNSRMIINNATVNSGQSCISNSSTSTLTINNATVKSTGASAVVNDKTGIININGGQFIAATNGVLNSSTGTVNICGGTIKGSTRDLTNQTTGKIYYKNNVIFTNGAGNPKKNSTGTISSSTTITCQ